jgi:hypothetical protein
MKPQPEALAAQPQLPHLDASGVYRRRGRLSYGVVGTYLILIALLFVILPSAGLRTGWAFEVILFLFIFFLVRYLSTTYSISDTHLRAWRLFGSRRIPLDQVRQIEYSSMRDLGPTGFIGSWGWRGRMWSPSIGKFDAVYTDPARGLLVTEGDVPIYISPVDLPGFARELSRRVRSYVGRLEVDVGDPQASPSLSEAES